jgi:uncharacterized protein YlxP (DUF503 family)
MIDVLNRKEKLAELQSILLQLKTQYNLGSEEIAQLLREEENMLPASLYQDRALGIMELTVKYMKENLGYSFSEIARLLNRDQRTIWVVYHNVTQKHPLAIHPAHSEYLIPASIFADREKGVLQAIVTYLKIKYSLRFADIGKILNRDPRVVCTVYHKNDMQ